MAVLLCTAVVHAQPTEWTDAPSPRDETAAQPSESETEPPTSESATDAPPDDSDSEPSPPHDETATPPSDSDTATPPSESELPSGTEAFQQGRFQEAHDAFSQELQETPVEELAQRATLYFNLGSCSYELGKYERAQQEFALSAELDPETAADAWVLAGYSALAANDLDAAQEHQGRARQALDLAGDRAAIEVRLVELETAMQARQAALDSASLPEPEPEPEPEPSTEDQAEAREGESSSPHDLSLRKRGVHGWLGVAGGYDTNAVQGGAAGLLGISVPGADAGSPMGSADASLGYTGHANDETALTLAYEGFLLAYSTEQARELNLYVNDLVGRVQLLSSPLSRWEVTARGSLTLSGWDSIAPLVSDVRLGLRWDRLVLLDSPEQALQWTLRAEGGRQFGLEDYEYLSGWMARLRLSLSTLHPTWDLKAWAGGRYHGIGALDIDITGDELVHCAEGSTNPTCIQLQSTPGTYWIPLGYAGPATGVDFSWYVGERWFFESGAALAARFYLEDSIARLATSSVGNRAEQQAGANSTIVASKYRWDVRPSGYLGGYYSLDKKGAVSLGVDYNLLVSASNMAREEPEQDLGTDIPVENSDYDNRNFTEHQVSARIDLSF